MTLKEITKITNPEGLFEYLRDHEIFKFPTVNLNYEKVIYEIDRRMIRSEALTKYIISLIYKNTDQRDSVMQEFGLTKLSAQEKCRWSKDPLFTPEYWYSGRYCAISDDTKLSDIILSEEEEAALDHLNINNNDITMKELKAQLEIIRYYTTSNVDAIEKLAFINITNYCNIYPCNLIKDVYGELTMQQASNAIAFKDTLAFLYNEILNNEAFTDRHRLVITKRYKEEGNTLSGIGEELGVSTEVIRQNIGKAERMMRHPSRSKCIKAILDLDITDHNTVVAINRYIRDTDSKASRIINILSNGKIVDGVNIICESELLKAILISDENDLIKIFTRFDGNDIAKIFLGSKYNPGIYPMELCTIENHVFSLETPIEELDLSVRSYNCLKRSNINTIKDLLDLMCSYTDDDGNPDPITALNHIRNLGRRSMKEVMEKMSTLKMI